MKERGLLSTSERSRIDGERQKKYYAEPILNQNIILSSERDEKSCVLMRHSA